MRLDVTQKGEEMFGILDPNLTFYITVMLCLNPTALVPIKSPKFIFQWILDRACPILTHFHGASSVLGTKTIDIDILFLSFCVANAK